MARSKNTSRFAYISVLAFSAMCLQVGWMSPSQAQTTEGYRPLPGSAGMVVDRAEHWEKWTQPTHATTIDPVNHTVAPRLTRKNVNVIENLDQFRIKIGDQKAYDKLLKDLTRVGAELPLNIVAGPASVVGVPIVHLKDSAKNNIKVGDPVIWYFHQGGIRETFNNPDAAPNILDGDPSTYWEPSTEVSQEEYQGLPPAEKGPVYYFAKDAAGRESRVDQEIYQQASSSRRRIQYNSRSLENWYVDVDLGRVVPVSKVVMRFADEDMGEPFRQFRILTTPFSARDAALSLTARTVTSNVENRILEFDDLVPVDPTIDHVLVHRMRIQITDSKFGKFKQVSEEEFLDLPAEDQGDIEYFIIDAVGRETRVDKELFDQVDQDRRGRRALYQRERPRLTDIEVWAQGDNVALGIIDGGGSVELLGPRGATGGFDGLYDTLFEQSLWFPNPTYEDRGFLTVDLGALFWIDQMRWIGLIDSRDEFITRVSDGTRDTNGNLKWTEIDRSEPGENRLDYEQALDSPMQVRFLFSMATSTFNRTGGARIPHNKFKEVQLFGQGHPPEVVLTSPLIEMPGAFVLGNIEWEADIPDPDLVDVEIRTRTGNRLREITQYFSSTGGIKTETEYNKLPASFKGPVVDRKVMGGGWSPWSQHYLESGDRITSPSPRRFLQVQVKLISQAPDLAAKIRSVRVGFLPAVARNIPAEIWPNEVSLGTSQDFEFYLNPSFVERDARGRAGARFDEILLDAAPIKALELLDVSLGQEEELQNDSAQRFTEIGSHTVSGQQSYWFEDASGERYQALIDPVSGDTLKVVEGGIEAVDGTTTGPRLHLRLPHKVELLPQAEESRTYNRIILEEGEEVPVDEDGRHLNELTYLSLSAEQRGRIVYFQLGTGVDGAPVQEEISDFQYRSLPDSLQGEVIYFRRLIGQGGEFPFDREGNRLDQAAYNRLPTIERGSIVAAGELVRIRFKARVFLNGSTIDASVRDSSAPESWQQVDAGDATFLREGASLNIAVPVSSRLIQDVEIAPNPFTPNGDGINDQMQIRFAIGNLNADRKIQVEIFDLNGRLIWQQSQMGFGEQNFVWHGRDNGGQAAPPGLYLCKIEVDADSKSASHTVDYQVVAVAY